MNLITYAGKGGGNHGWYVRIYAKNGAIIFSPDLAFDLKLKERSTVRVHQHRERQEKWFFEFSSKNGYGIYKVNKRSLGFCDRVMVTRMLHSILSTSKKGKCLIDNTPLEYEGSHLYAVDITSL